MKLAKLVEISDLFQHAYFWVITVGAGLLFIVRRRWKARKQTYVSVAEYVTSEFGPLEQVNAAIAKSFSCVIVDDEPDDFPVDFLRGFFGELSVETKVSLNDAERLSKKDVIFLDVAGVVLEDLQRGGAVLIERIRRHFPDGIIISVSSKKYDVEVTDYFANADIRIRKPIQAAACQEQILAHLRNRSGPHALASAIDSSALRILGVRGRRGLIRSIQNEITSSRSIKAPDSAIKAGVAREFESIVKLLRRLKR